MLRGYPETNRDRKTGVGRGCIQPGIRKFLQTLEKTTTVITKPHTDVLGEQREAKTSSFPSGNHPREGGKRGGRDRGRDKVLKPLERWLLFWGSRDSGTDSVGHGLGIGGGVLLTKIEDHKKVSRK